MKIDCPSQLIVEETIGCAIIGLIAPFLYRGPLPRGVLFLTYRLTP